MIENSKLLLIGTALLASCNAQTNLTDLPAPTLNNTLMNLTFSDPSAANCGRSTTQLNESATIMIRTSARNSACLDLDYIFTNPNVTYAPDEDFTSTADGMRYTVSTSGWSPEIFNYSQVFYTQRRPNVDQVEDDSALGSMMVRAFKNAGCPGEGNNQTASEWYSWDCQDEEGECSTLPFAVKSILLTAPIKGSVGQKGCVKDEIYNGAAAKSGVAVGAVVMVGVGMVAAGMM